MIHLERIIFTGLLLSGLLHEGFAQTHVVTGRVVDAASNTPLPFANVFIDRTTIGTAADGEGYFVLKGVPPGSVELLFSFVGYKLGRRVINVSGESDIGTIGLQVSEQQLSEVEVKASRDKTWEKQFKKFKRIFIGSGLLSKSCSIQNPWVIDFKEIEGETIVSADQPIQIRNDFLGYMIYFYIDKTKMNKMGYLIRGNIRFAELPPLNDAQTHSWAENRHKSYLRSPRHLFKSIIDQNISSEGFNLYEDIGSGKSNSYLAETDNFRVLIENTLKKKDTTDLLSPNDDSTIYKIKIDKRLEVHYRYARAPIRAYSDIGYPVSWLLAKGGYIYVDKRGIPLNSHDVIASGDMIQDWITTSLPSDYQPPRKVKPPTAIKATILHAKEQIYMHTDKPYYYPGETIWFKIYVNHDPPSYIDSLSKTIHLEFFSPDGEAIVTKLLLVDQRISYGEITIADSLDAGTYYIRAYTNFQRNFGDSLLYVRQVPILQISDKVVGLAKDSIGSNVTLISISSDKERYKVHEKITLKIKARDELTGPISANLSVTVWDTNQVTSIDCHSDIIKEFPFKKYDLEAVGKSNFQAEQGLSLGGKIMNRRLKPISGSISVLDAESKDMVFLRANRQGEFWLKDLIFFGNRKLLIQAKDKKGRPIENIKVFEREVPPFKYPSEPLKFKIISTPGPQNNFLKYEKENDSKMQKGISQEGKISKDFQIINLQGYSSPKSFTSPNYDVLKGEIFSDFRSTIYWNPHLVTTPKSGEAKITFYAASLATTYLVIVEGITYDNLPVRGQYWIRIDE